MESCIGAIPGTGAPTADIRDPFLRDGATQGLDFFEATMPPPRHGRDDGANPAQLARRDIRKRITSQGLMMWPRDKAAPCG